MAKVFRIIFMVVALLAMAMGLLWILQGLNIVRWPETSFMLGVPQWSWRGAALMGMGALLLWRVRRRR
jgi:hypothetical protein